MGWGWCMANPKIVTCVECDRTFYASNFSGRLLPRTQKRGICRWCLNPEIDPLEDDTPKTDDTNGTIYKDGIAIGRCIVRHGGVVE